MAGKEDQIKTEIAVDGEQEYKKACKEIDASAALNFPLKSPLRKVGKSGIDSLP